MLASAGGVASSDLAALKRKKKAKRGNRGGKKHGGVFRDKERLARANRNFEYVLAQTQEQLLLPDPEEEQKQPVDEGRFSKLPRLQLEQRVSSLPPGQDPRLVNAALLPSDYWQPRPLPVCACPPRSPSPTN